MQIAAFATCVPVSSHWLSKSNRLQSLNGRYIVHSTPLRRHAVVCKADVETSDQGVNALGKNSKTDELRTRLLEALSDPPGEGINRGLGIDADKETMDEDEAEVCSCANLHFQVLS